ncbi:MAG: hypothetical protein HKO95_03160 [Rhodobacteraceae bacterium]|nr:AEC family transporter [Alphaproteobacteria bacterium]NNF72331.1 hypothetical protein [Paracoccaceae bacterium]NNK65716.1 hypothetical protein [Paracoccaceae bacterium]
MLSTLADPVLPIFAVLAAGYMLNKAGAMDASHAQAINRFVFYLAAPALGIAVIGRAAFDTIHWPAVGVYFAAELAVYAAVFALMRFAFKRDLGEALLLGMTAVFANHVFFVLPIAERSFGAEAAIPMAGIVLIDIAVIFIGSVLLTEIIASDNRSLRRTLAGLARNPFVYAPPIGLALGALGATAPSGIWTFLDFTAAAAAPVVLFSLGITLGTAPIFPVRLPCWSVTMAKLFAVPALAWGGLDAVGPMEPLTRDITLLVAAGPCGAMPYVIATQYNIRTQTIAKTVLLSTVLSLVTLSVLLP